MRRLYQQLTARMPNENGQTMVIVVLALGLFLLGAVGFGVDIANLWFHRQAAQTAADAACTAGAMDLLYDAESGPAPSSGSGSWAWIGQNSLDCSGHFATGSSMYSPCWYAAQNGYSASGEVLLNSPTSVSGVSGCSSNLPAGQGCLPSSVANPLLRVNVDDPVRIFFTGMITGAKTMNVGAQAICGVVSVQSPVPLLVLDPQAPNLSGKKNGSDLSVQGTPTIAIWGGPTQSIQVNSDDSAALNVGGSGSINLTQGGPSNSGSTIGVTGGPTSNPGVTCSTTNPNCYIAPHAPISDPYANYAAPSPPANGTVTHNVATGTHGCPTGTTCDEYTPGYYSGGIAVKGVTAIFDPGLYYLAGGKNGGLTADSNSCLRPSNFDSAGNGWGGVMFYLSGSGTTISVDNNSGSKCTAAFSTTTGSGVLANGIKCQAGSSTPSNMPSTLSGNVMLAPCTGPYGDPFLAEGQSDPTTNCGAANEPPCGEQRGILLFEDRSVTNINNQTTGPSWGGAGSFLLAGSIYLHSCDATGTGGPCGSTPTYYSDFFTLQGSSGSATWVLGNIVTDNLVLGGNSSITMDLNSSAAYYILKASLLQ